MIDPPIPHWLEEVRLDIKGLIRSARAREAIAKRRKLNEAKKEARLTYYDNVIEGRSCDNPFPNSNDKMACCAPIHRKDHYEMEECWVEHALVDTKDVNEKVAKLIDVGYKKKSSSIDDIASPVNNPSTQQTIRDLITLHFLN